MGFDITLLWNFPVGILRLVTVIIGGAAIGLLTQGHYANLQKEVAALGIVSFCCIGSFLVTASLVSGVLDVSKKKLKKLEFIYATLCAILVLSAGILMFISVFNERPNCTFGVKNNPCQESFALSVAGGSLSIVNCLVYGVLAYYLIKKL